MFNLNHYRRRSHLFPAKKFCFKGSTFVSLIRPVGVGLALIGLVGESLSPALIARVFQAGFGGFLSEKLALNWKPPVIIMRLNWIAGLGKSPCEIKRADGEAVLREMEKGIFPILGASFVLRQKYWSMWQRMSVHI